MFYFCSPFFKENEKRSVGDGVWRSPASVPALGAGGRRFESCYPDNLSN